MAVIAHDEVYYQVSHLNQVLPTDLCLEVLSDLSRVTGDWAKGKGRKSSFHFQLSLFVGRAEPIQVCDGGGGDRDTALIHARRHFPASPYRK